MRVTHTEATRILAERDPVMAALVEHHGPVRMRPRTPVAARFEASARAIAHQQLAGAAAVAIWQRVQAAVGTPFTPERVLALDPQDLRGAGLSNAKVLAVLDLATKVASGEVRLDRLGRLDDDSVVAELTKVRGIGPWSAHMVLLFDLRRIDVWPTGDYGVRSGYARAYGLRAIPTEKELIPLGDAFAPYRSIAAWYCWRAADSVSPES